MWTRQVLTWSPISLWRPVASVTALRMLSGSQQMQKMAPIQHRSLIVLLRRTMFRSRRSSLRRITELSRRGQRRDELSAAFRWRTRCARRKRRVWHICAQMLDEARCQMSKGVFILLDNKQPTMWSWAAETEKAARRPSKASDIQLPWTLCKSGAHSCAVGWLVLRGTLRSDGSRDPQSWHRCRCSRSWCERRWCCCRRGSPLLRSLPIRSSSPAFSRWPMD